MNISFKRNYLHLILLIMLLAACRQETPTAVSTPTPTQTQTAVPNPTATSRPATPTPTSEPTPIRPAITVDDQVLDEDGSLTIAAVTASETAWLVIHAEHDGQVGEVLGVTAVAPGSNNDITLTIDPLQATPRLVAILHQDAGEIDEFEFPGPDDPLLADGETVSAEFSVDIQVDLPAITIANQEVLDDGLVHIESVFSPTPGWLLIIADENGSVGPLLGHVFLRAGTSENVIVPIQWRDATPTMHAILLEDGDRSTRLDYPDGDLPIIVNNQPVMASFFVTLPPDVYVLDQPVVDGKIVADRVISDGPGWLVVYFDENELPGRIIGSAPLADGLNEFVKVEVLERATTDVLHIQIHDDEEPVGQFTFPNGDIPRLYHGRLPATFTFQTNLGHYLVTRDQTLAEQSVIISLTVTNTPGWLVIRTGLAPDDGDIIGSTWLPAGINRDVAVELDEVVVDETLYAVLHADLAEPEQFDFPGGDGPLRHNGRIVQSLFTLFPLTENDE